MDRWKTIQDLNNTNPTTSPRTILHNNKIHNNPQDTADIANNYYIDTIKQLRHNIPHVPVSPIEILKNI